MSDAGDAALDRILAEQPEVGEEGDLDEEGPGNPVGDRAGGATDEEE